MKVSELKARLEDFADTDEIFIETSHDVDEEDKYGRGRRWPILDLFCESAKFGSADITIIRTDY